LEKNFQKGKVLARLKAAENLFARGASPEFVREITGLDCESFKRLQPGL